MGVFYATVDAVLDAIDGSGAELERTLRRVIESASRTIDGDRPTGKGLLGRRFYPEVATRTFTGGLTMDPLYRLSLGRYDLASATTVVSGGVTISGSGYALKPQDGPPYDRIELVDGASPSTWSTTRDGVSITGVWNYSCDETATGTVAEVLDVSETDVDVSNSAAIGVGSIVRVDTERMIVTDRAMVTTGQNLQTPLTASVADRAVVVTDGTAYAVGELVTLDSETMKITQIVGNTLTVRRAWNGSVLDDHAGATLYAPRRLTVQRGALGTGAATHLTAAPLYRVVIPPLVESLCVALAVVQLEQEGAAYARSNAGEGGGSTQVGASLETLTEQAQVAFRRRTTWLGV